MLVVSAPWGWRDRASNCDAAPARDLAPAANAPLDKRDKVAGPGVTAPEQGLASAATAPSANRDRVAGKWVAAPARDLVPAVTAPWAKRAKAAANNFVAVPAMALAEARVAVWGAAWVAAWVAPADGNG